MLAAAVLGAALVLSAGSVVSIDQASKAMLLACLGPRDAICFGRRVRFRRVLNARWIYRRRPARGCLLFLWVAVVCGIALLVVVGAPIVGGVAYIGFGSALGGATSNLVDWVARGAVVDVVDVGFWPVFNLADVMIVFGALAAFGSMV